MKILIYMGLCILLFTVGCSNEAEDGGNAALGSIEKHFVINYRNVDSIDFHYIEHLEDLSLPEMGFSAYGKNLSEQWEYDNFRKYANLYNDTSFYQPSSCVFCGSEGAILDTIKNITILCDKSYNNTHNPNENINHLVNIRYSSAKEAIENDYFKDQYKYLSTPFYTTRLDSFNLHQNYLLGTRFTFSLLESPENTDNYTFTIIYQEESDLKITKQLPPILVNKESN